MRHKNRKAEQKRRATRYAHTKTRVVVCEREKVGRKRFHHVEIKKGATLSSVTALPPRLTPPPPAFGSRLSPAQMVKAGGRQQGKSQRWWGIVSSSRINKNQLACKEGTLSRHLLASTYLLNARSGSYTGSDVAVSVITIARQGRKIYVINSYAGECTLIKVKGTTVDHWMLFYLPIYRLPSSFLISWLSYHCFFPPVTLQWANVWYLTVSWKAKLAPPFFWMDTFPYK